ncbi:RNA-binding protein [Trichophyton mentagrophytes]|uniref:RRM domain-containing protein n=1 Tax=Trichophyton interdigitale (strain MR816) TaxID=1215338 RepID=A0A059JFD7_TRIIM|nr:hypothetical protein H101_01107 [Trichophyton interdigitale H6]KAG5205800.1 Transformer-SR ribonucleoprotein [Trichophyton interdigitale]KDB26388.1 hypothetical protein H109_01812 [Trichophyton interdigitale MR816]GBF66194.1 RNA-binding protein [Trichophyton mentagrophytes]KAG5218554.1 Transformer-SR ribonucleoprotein [Trichophyton interdigitale]
MADMEYENENDRFEDPQYRRRSASPQDANRATRNRSASPNGRTDRAEGTDARMKNADDEEGAQNTGTNLFVTGIHPRLSEADVTRLFEKYGEVENCSIMLDPHTKESRGFGFVNMATPDQAEAAREGLQGEVIDGRTLSIEKARRSRPRTPTPGKYFGPPKRELRGHSRGGRYDRYDDRRGGYGGHGRRYDDGYRSSRYDSYSDRGSRRDYRDDYGHRGVDRYATSGRDDRYGDRGERSDRGGDRERDRGDRRGDRRGGGYYDRDDARAQSASGGYADAPSHRESYEPSGSRAYDNRWDDRTGPR